MTTDEMVVDVSQDWLLACDVQQGFMQTPCTVSDSLDYSARCRQVRALGGDCYNFFPLKSDQLALVVGDASGKGLAAALMIANVQSSLRTAALFTGDDLDALLKAVNHPGILFLAERTDTRPCSTESSTTRNERCDTSMQDTIHPLFCDAIGSVEWLETSGAPVGMFPDSIYEEKHRRRLRPETCLSPSQTESLKRQIRTGRNGEFRAY